jgi:cell division inhibitor SepF
MFKDWMQKKMSDFSKFMLSPDHKEFDPNEEDGDDYEDTDYEDEPAIRHSRTATHGEPWQIVAQKATAPKSIFREKKYNDKVVELYGPKNKTESLAHIEFACPKDVSHSNIVTDCLKEGKIVAVNLTNVERIQAQRIVDVVAGGVYALGASINRISKDIFIAAPEGVQVSGDIKEEISRDHSWAFAK